MARWEIIREGNKTTIKRNHPIWDAFVVLFGIALVVSSVEKAPWLIVPTILILGGAVWLRVKASQKAGHGSPTQANAPKQSKAIPTRKSAIYRLARYDGGLPIHPKPEESGTLTLTDQRWELRFRRTGQFSHFGLVRYPLEVIETGPNSCHVTITDTLDPSVLASFHLPDTSTATLSAELEARLRDIELGKIGNPTCRLAHYDGGLPLHPRAEESGLLALVGDKLQLQFPGTQLFSGGLARYRLAITETAANSCHVVMTDLEAPGFVANFDLPDTSAATLSTKLPRPQPMTAIRRPTTPIHASPLPALGIADELAKLADLHTKAVLTDAEFAAQTARLLGRS
jgi:hypothetical protein